VLSSSLPVDAVAFTTDALLLPGQTAPQTDPVRQGGRRLIRALAQHGVRTPVIVPEGQEPGHVMALLTNVGFDPLPVLQASLAEGGPGNLPDAHRDASLAYFRLSPNRGIEPYKWMKFETCEENIMSAIDDRASNILPKHNDEIRRLYGSRSII
jgi:hypothetical protein